MSKKDDKAIKGVLANLEKRFGEKVVMRMNDAGTDAKTFSSGRPLLDEMLGGGYGVGKIVEIYAESGCGKTGLALEAIKVIQDMGGEVALIDAEHALNTEYCTLLGIDTDKLLISQPSYGEQAMEAIRALIPVVDLIVVDSVSALVPKAELEGESGEIKMALQARMMSQGMKLISGPASDNDTTILFINQLRSTIAMYGPSTTTTGGKALPFYASQRLEVKRKGWMKQGEEVIGFHQHIKITKNKIGSPFKTCEFDIEYGKGVDSKTGLIDGLVFEEIVIKRGSYFYYGDVRLAQGMKNLRLVLEDNPELEEELTLKLAEAKA